MTKEMSKDGLFDTIGHAGPVTREEASHAISDLVSALSEGKPKDGIKGNVELRNNALKCGRHLIKRMLSEGWAFEEIDDLPDGGTVAGQVAKPEPIHQTEVKPVEPDTDAEEPQASFLEPEESSEEA